MSEREDCPDFDPSRAYDDQADIQGMLELANAKMPFGKYAGRYLTDLPEHYLIWFRNKGFPAGELGRKMEAVFEMQANGLEHLLRPLRGRG